MVGGHAVAVTGFVRDTSYAGGGYFAFKNSWGSSFGARGYGHLPVAYCQSSPCYFLAIRSVTYDGRTTPVSGAGLPPAAAGSFKAVQDNVFTPICTTCHSGASAPLGLRLDAANSYALLVNVPSVEVGSLKRVAPGDPANSYLVQKIEGRASVGARMPLGGPALSQANIDLVRAWIASGAPVADTGGTVASAPFAIASTIPAEGESAAAGMGELTLVFTAGVDASLASAGTIELAGPGGADLRAGGLARGLQRGGPADGERDDEVLRLAPGQPGRPLRHGELRVLRRHDERTPPGPQELQVELPEAAEVGRRDRGLVTSAAANAIIPAPRTGPEVRKNPVTPYDTTPLSKSNGETLGRVETASPESWSKGGCRIATCRHCTRFM